MGKEPKLRDMHLCDVDSPLRIQKAKPKSLNRGTEMVHLPHTSDFLSRFCSGLDFPLDYRLGTFVCAFPPRLPVHLAPSVGIHLTAPLRRPVSWLLYGKSSFSEEDLQVSPSPCRGTALATGYPFSLILA